MVANISSPEIGAAFQAGNEALGRGELAEAVAYYERAIELAGEHDVTTMALASGNSAIALARLGHYGEAHRRFERSLRHLGPLREPLAAFEFMRGDAQVLNELGRFEHSLGILSESIRQLRELRETAIALGEGGPLVDGLAREEMHTVLALSGALLMLHRFEEVEAIASAVIDDPASSSLTERRALIGALINRAQARRESGNHNDALSDLERALQCARELGDPLEVAQVHGIMGYGHVVAGRPEVGVSLIEDSIASAEAAGQHTVALKRGMAHAEQLAAKELEAAWAVVERSLQTVASVESPVMRADFFRTAANVALRRRDEDAEQQFLARAWEAWHETVEQQSTPDLRAHLASIGADLSRRLVARHARAGDAATAWRVFEEGRAAGLRTHLANFRGMGATSPQPASVDSIADWIRQRSKHRSTAVAAVMVAPPGEIVVLTISLDGVSAVQRAAVDVEVFRREIDDLASAIPKPDDPWEPFALEAPIYAISERIRSLFEPIRALATDLVILPTSVFWPLPWSSILGSFELVTIAPSATWLIAQPPTPQSLTGPVRSIGFGFARGRDLADECRALESTQVLAEIAVGDDASAGALISFLRQSGAVHVSAHGSWLSDQHGSSGLALADGVVGSQTILGLRVEAELIALSACDSGRAHVSANDDAVGIAHALLAAGASNVVASLWPVDASSAQLFMLELFAKLRSGESVARAFAYARACVEEQHPELRHSAAFELFGAG